MLRKKIKKWFVRRFRIHEKFSHSFLYDEAKVFNFLIERWNVQNYNKEGVNVQITLHLISADVIEPRIFIAYELSYIQFYWGFDKLLVAPKFERGSNPSSIFWRGVSRLEK